MSDLKLIEAVKTENMKAVKELIEAKADVNQQDEQGWTPLNWAAGKGNLEIVSDLVSQGADVFKVGRDQRTPYMIALAAGREKVARYLRQVEDEMDGEKPARPERKYCKAYYLRDLRRFPLWSESRINWKENNNRHATPNDEAGGGEFTDDDIVFLHQDYIVTESMWHNENVIFNQVTPDWKEFCKSILQYKVPDDFDLIVAGDTPSTDKVALEKAAAMSYEEV